METDFVFREIRKSPTASLSTRRVFKNRADFEYHIEHYYGRPVMQMRFVKIQGAREDTFMVSAMLYGYAKYIPIGFSNRIFVV